MAQHRRGSARRTAAELAVGRRCRLRPWRSGDCHIDALLAVCRKYSPGEELGLVAGFNRCRDKHFPDDQCNHSRRACFTRGLLVGCAGHHRRLSVVVVRAWGSQAAIEIVLMDEGKLESESANVQPDILSYNRGWPCL